MTTDMLALIEPVIPALRRYARALMRDPAAADDLVQDCLERAIGRWRQRRADSDTRAWMFSILHNLAMTRLRRNAERPAHVALDGMLGEQLAVAATQEVGLRMRDLLAALGALPEDQRAVLLLVGVESLSYAKAARVLDVPIGTVMSRLSRGRERLARLMADEAASGSVTAYLRRVK